MKKSVRKKLIIIPVIVAFMLAGILIYNSIGEKVRFSSAACSDSDVISKFPDGKNPLLKGIISLTDSTGNIRNYTDKCITNNMLEENYCYILSDRNIFRKYLYYNCTGSLGSGYKCSNGACIPVNSVSCSELYSGNNIASDSSRFNIVFIGNGFRTTEDLKSAAKRVIDMDETSTTPTETTSISEKMNETISDGLMQIPVFKNNKNRFNFWYVDYTKPFTSKDPSTVWKELYNFDLINSCQDTLPNRIIPIFIYPAQGNGVGYPYASYGRYYVTLFDCIDSESSCLGGDYPNLQNGNIHELLHTIPCLGDEYGALGNYNLSKAVNYTGNLSGNGVYQYYVGNSYADCMANAPWISGGHLGNGCGVKGSIDCFSNNCTQPISYVNGIDTQPECCISGKDCGMEVGCFEGGSYADKRIWRSSSSSVLRNPYLGKLTGSQFISEWDQEIVYRVIQKGPAIGKVWKEGQNYNLDCDATIGSV